MKLNYKNKLHKDYLYLGENENNNYFEGWYFKHTDKENKYSISFIVGVSKSEKPESFIQIIDSIQNKSYYIKYNLEDFKFSNDPFYIKIKDNYFSLDKIIVNINDKVNIKANIEYGKLTKINKNYYSPNIMGPFAYLTFLECNHSVISLRHKLNGSVKIGNQNINFTNGTGYIEKDYGTSFPEKYIWLESNSNKNSNIFFSLATIPIFKLKFNGIISILEINNKQYRFASYYLARTKIKKLDNNNYLITVKQFSKKLIINLNLQDVNPLSSPKKGNMSGIIKESLNSTCNIILYKGKKKIFEDNFKACGCEIFNF